MRYTIVKLFARVGKITLPSRLVGWTFIILRPLATHSCAGEMHAVLHKRRHLQPKLAVWQQLPTPLPGTVVQSAKHSKVQQPSHLIRTV